MMDVMKKQRREIEAAAHCRRRPGQLRAVQILLGHTKIESTVRYLGIEIDDALAIAEQVDVPAERTRSARLRMAGSCH